MNDNPLDALVKAPEPLDKSVQPTTPTSGATPSGAIGQTEPVAPAPAASSAATPSLNPLDTISSSTPVEQPNQATSNQAETINPLDSLQAQIDDSAKQSTSAMPEVKPVVQTSSPQPIPATPLTSSVPSSPEATPKNTSPTPQIQEHEIPSPPSVTSPVQPLAVPPAPSITDTTSGLQSSNFPAPSVSTPSVGVDTALNQEELEAKAKSIVGNGGSTGSSKKPWVFAGLTAVFVMLVAGGGLLSYQLLGERSTDDRTQAGFTGKNACISPKGIVVATEPAPGESGGFNYKPATANPNDATAYYDVSKGETVSFSVELRNTTDQPVSDQYHFFTQKVIESPAGTKVDENSPLDEITLANNHGTDGKGDVQETIFNTDSLPFTIPANGTHTITGTWKPDNAQCGLYQVDLGVIDYENASCARDLVVAAGFIRVKNCQQLACVELAHAPAAPKIGEQLELTCTGSAEAVSYEFRFKLDDGAYTPIPALDSASNKAQLQIVDAGEYFIQCRACKDSSTCSAWETITN